MKYLAVLFILISHLTASGQRYNSMHANRYSYVYVGAGIPYASLKTGYEMQRNVYVEFQAHTDGGGIWRSNTHNDWRAISLLRAIRLNPIRTEVRLGIGILQSEERIINQKSNTFGVAPQIAIATNVRNNIAIGGSVTWPISPAVNLTPAVGGGIEVRFGRYVKENGLH